MEVVRRGIGQTEQERLVLECWFILRYIDGIKIQSCDTMNSEPPFPSLPMLALTLMAAFPADGRINDRATLEPDTWYDVGLEWTGTEDISAHACRVYIDGRLQSESLPLKSTSRNGICYVRFRSTAVDEDLAGWMVETAKADAICNKWRLLRLPISRLRTQYLIETSPRTTGTGKRTTRNLKSIRLWSQYHQVSVR